MLVCTLPFELDMRRAHCLDPFLADGSIMAHSDVEFTYPENVGLEDIVEEQRPFALKHNVSFGDL